MSELLDALRVSFKVAPGQWYRCRFLLTLCREERKNARADSKNFDALKKLDEVVTIACKYIQHVALYHAHTSPKGLDDKSSIDAWERVSSKLAAKIPELWGKYRLKAERALELDEKANGAAIVARKNIMKFVEKGNSAQTKVYFADEVEGRLVSRTYKVTNTTSAEVLAAFVMLSQKARGRKHVAHLDFYSMGKRGEKEPKEHWGELPGALLAVMDRGWFRFNVEDPRFPSLCRNIFRIREGEKDVVYLRGTLYRNSGTDEMPSKLDIRPDASKPNGLKLEGCSQWIQLYNHILEAKVDCWVATDAIHRDTADQPTAAQPNHAISPPTNNTSQGMGDQPEVIQPKAKNNSPGSNSLPPQEVHPKSAVSPPPSRIPPPKVSATSVSGSRSPPSIRAPTPGPNKLKSLPPDRTNRKQEGWLRRVVRAVFGT